MKTLLLPAIGTLVIALFVGQYVMASDTGTVSATVTVQNISVSVTDGSVAYLTIAAGGTQDTTTAGVNDSQTATNDGNITEKFNIKGANTTGCVWTLYATQDANKYFHKFCTTTCDTSPSWTALTTDYQTLAASIAKDGTQVFDLQIGVPTSSSCYTEATANVTVQAALP